MNKNKSMVNGNKNMDTPEMEMMRQQVIEQELSARSYKAYYEKMYYALEAEKLEPQFAEWEVRTREKLMKKRKEYEDFLKTMQEQAASINQQNPNGDLVIDEVVKDEAPVIQMSK